MPISDVYTHRSGSQAVASVAATPVLSVFGTAAKRLWAVGIRFGVGKTAAPAGNTILVQLARPGNTPIATGLASGSSEDFSAPASIGQFAVTWTTAPTVGTVLAGWQVAQVTASPWTEYPPTNYEWGIPAIANSVANAGLHVFVTNSDATSTPVFAELIVSE